MRMPYRLISARRLEALEGARAGAEAAVSQARREVAQANERMRETEEERAALRQEAREALADRDMALRLLVGSADLTEEQWAAITDALASALTPPGLTRLRDLLNEARRTRRADGLEPGERVLAGGGAHAMTVTAVTADGPGRVRIEGRLTGGAPYAVHLAADERLELADTDTATADGTGEVHR